MEKKISDKDNKIPLVRREAIIRAGKYAVFTAVEMLTVLSPQKAIGQNGSDIPPATYSPKRLPKKGDDACL